jgi:hypothetical protein
MRLIVQHAPFSWVTAVRKHPVSTIGQRTILRPTIALVNQARWRLSDRYIT